ncbi:MAG: hypothetical protein A3G18_10210 [Rhodospirillales bacterium RIFCSPLOWO2_12_FULL_58_28]|nr:MAG: hypothetical protein A3H92_08385 [Rhodospirillales bacterium RIFCSPLOWO2_02_FULL_58_16]OHC77652.1 MAG: hypothetical protein A3G18_10210 [Rhodospirillales bacterium RIFCSPLOWO2_12_FULL_58_28]
MKSPVVIAQKVSGQAVGAQRLVAGLPVVLALLLGFFMLIGVGFAGTTHDVAHDTRHSFGFPCH